jgi:hypothetical protein
MPLTKLLATNVAATAVLTALLKTYEERMFSSFKNAETDSQQHQ